MRCFIASIYYTLRYGLSRRALISGHKLQYTSGVYLDYWIMKCAVCGKEAYSEVGPHVKVEAL